MEENSTNVTATEAMEKNYIDIISDMKKSTVSKDEYDRVLADNRKLAESLAYSNPSSTEDEASIPTDDEVNEMRKNLFVINKRMSNLDFCKNALDLRDALIARGEQDPFLPTNKDYIITDLDRAEAEKVANGLRQMVEYCDGDAQLFNSELKRCCK